MNLRLKNKRTKGYLLIEVLVVIVILAVAIVFIVRALSSSLFAARRATSYTKAISAAEQLYSDIKLEMSEGRALARESFPRSLQLTIDNINFQCSEELSQTSIPDLSEIIFNISWKDSNNQMSFALSSFIPTAAAE